MDDKQVCEGLQSGSWSCFDEGWRENMTSEKSDYFSLFPGTEMFYVCYELCFLSTFLLFRGPVCESKNESNKRLDKNLYMFRKAE